MKNKKYIENVRSFKNLPSSELVFKSEGEIVG
jgi:hypothetical protein